ncbi:MAG: sugar ABC transporter ATP-binding protein [Anaerolineales bacterium]
MLVMRGIHKSFDGTQALRGVDFSAERQEVHAIVGENGAGKSTLVKILAGAIPRDAGEILLDGVAADARSPLAAHRLGIRAVYQEFSLVSHLTVAENILLGQMPSSRVPGAVDWGKAYRRADEILESIGFVAIDVRKVVRHMSVFHQQVVEIAKAVAVRPRILILDEPSAVASQEELDRLFALVRLLQQEGTLILYISHRLDEVFEIADRITVLKDGQRVGTVRPQEADQGQLIRMMVGRSLGEIFPSRQPSLDEVALEVKNLARAGSFSDISFSLHRGEVLGMSGLVGSGRTQVARCIFGADPFDTGEVHLGGKPIHPRSPREAVRFGIALLTEDRKRDGLVMHWTIRDNVSMASYDKLSRWGVINRSAQATQVQQKVHELDIRPPLLERLARHLSGGNQQKLVLAKWLMTQATVLILDEPTRGVDVATKVEIYQLISDLAARGIGILLISSELPEILGLSDRALVMREGRIVGEFIRAEASEERLLAAAAGVKQ